MESSKLTIEPRKILIVKPSSLGDIVHSLPALHAIKSRFGTAEIHWVVARGFEGVLEGHPMIDKLWTIDKDKWKRIGNAKETLAELGSLSRRLKKEKFDLVIDLQGLLRSGIITASTGAGTRIGFEEAREGSRFFYTHKVAGGKNVHAVDRYLKIAAYLGCDISGVRFALPSPASQGSRFHIDQPYVVIVPGARWKTKRWPEEKFGRLAAKLPIRSVVIGSKADSDIADSIVSLSKGKSLSLAGRTSLKELVEIMGNARLVVSNDSGPMHIAAALDIPVFAIFGPTDPLRTGPYGIGHTIIRAEVACAPCFRRTCDDNQCMKRVPEVQVLEMIRSKRYL